MTIIDIISKCSPSDARTCLYYAGRYIKQAESFETHEKDIFDDVTMSAPSEKIKEITMLIIRAIEEREGASSTKFSNKIVLQVLDEITSIEAELPSDLSNEDLARGRTLAKNMTAPSISK